MMRLFGSIFALALLVAPPAFAYTPPPPPSKPVDIARFLGRWYEIARVPNQFERGDGCAAPTADYAQTDKGISLVQTCHRGSPTGSEKIYRPAAQILDAANTRFRLTYFALFDKDYWVLDHAPDYAWAIIGDPTGKFVWGFSRAPGGAVKDELVSHIKGLGYDIGRLEFPKQGG